MPQKLSRTAVARSAKTKARSQAQADAKSREGKAKDKENDKGKGKEKEEEEVEEEKVEGDMDVDSPPGPPPIIPETKEDEQLRARQLARMLIPDPSRGLRRLPCTPRFRPRVNVAGEEHHEDDEDEDEDEEEGEEDRTIMAPLSHRFTHRVGTLYTVRDTLVSMFHTVEAHRALLKVCGRLHMNIHPPELHAYYRASDGRVVGVLNDFDDAVTTASKTWTQMSDAQREEARRAARERDRARRRAIEKLGELRGGD